MYIRNSIVKISIISLATAMLLGITGCSGGGSDGDSGTGGGANSIVIGGNAVEGYLLNATVCYDLNNSLTCDAGEPSAPTSGTDGSFSLTVTPEQKAAAVQNASLLVSGGIDKDTGLAFVGSLRAPYDGTTKINVTPLTTMASAIVANGGSITDAYQQVADALNLDVSLVAADPVAVAISYPEVIQAAMTVQRIVKVMATATVTNDSTVSVNDAINDIYESLANAVAEVADNNTTSGMAAIVTAAANDANSSLTPAAKKATDIASIIETQVSDAVADGGYSPDDALVIDEAVEVVEAAVIVSVENNTTIDTTTVESEANDAADAANPVLIAVENLLTTYEVTADANQTSAIATGSGFTLSSQVTIASISVLSITDIYQTQDVIVDLAAAYRIEQVKAYVTNLGGSLSDSAISTIAGLNAFNATMTTAEFSTLIYATGNAELINLSLTVSPPEGLASLTDVEQAKQLFTDLRTQAMSVVDYNNSGTPGYLDSEASSMNTALNSVVTDMDYVSGMFDFLMDGINIAEDMNMTTIDTSFEGSRFVVLTKDGNSWSYDINETGTTDTWTGTITYPNIDNVNIGTFTTLNASIVGNLPLGYAYDTFASGLVNSQDFDGSVVVTKTSTGATIAVSGTIESNGDSFVISNMNGEMAYTTDSAGDPLPEYIKINGLTISGTVDGYNLNGTFTVNSYVQNTLLAQKGFLETVHDSYVNINFQCNPYNSAEVITSNVSLTYNNITYQLSQGNDSYTDDSYYSPVIIPIPYADIISALDYTASCAGGSIVVNNYSWSNYNDYLANTGYVPNEMTFTGSITNTTTSGSITGTLNAKWLNAVTMDTEDQNATPLVKVTLDGTLQMPSRPAMTVHLGYENSATQNIINATYAYDTTSIRVDGVFDLNMLNGDIDITSATGIRADIAVVNENIDFANSNVTKGGLVLGNFEDRVGIPVIKYIDGTFESLP